MTLIREYRALRGLSQADLAARIGRTQSYVSHLERGDMRPGRDTIKLLEDALGLPRGALFAAYSIEGTVPDRASSRVASRATGTDA